jgi:hypothetical protein
LVVGTRAYNDLRMKKGKAIRGSKAYSFRKGEDGLIPVKVSFRNVYTASDMFPVPGIYEVVLGFGGTVEDAILEKEIDLGM